MTNKIVQRSIEEFLTGYTPVYAPVMPLFLGRSKKYEVTAGQVNYRGARALGDIRSRRLGPKDTELWQISSGDSGKSFKKYFLGSQYIQSELQDTAGYEDVVAEVLDEHNVQNDELFLFGGGSMTATDNTQIVNNGLFWSADPNYDLRSSVAVAKDGNASYLPGFYSAVSGVLNDASDLDGDLVVFTYGDTLTAQMNGLFTNSENSFRSVISDAFDNVTFAKLPKRLVPAGANGIMAVNMSLIEVNYTLLPEIRAQGVNEEKSYAWTNFLMGSSMVDVKKPGAIVRQPYTFTP